MTWLMALLACSGGEEMVARDSATDTAGPCAALDLPVCPPECPVDAFAECGLPCPTEGEACGNSIGDGRVCQDGVWACTVHAPLEPEGCNQVCRPAD